MDSMFTALNKYDEHKNRIPIRIYIEEYHSKKEETKATPLFPLFFYTIIGKLKSTSKPPYSLCFISIFPPCANMICLTMSSPKP